MNAAALDLVQRGPGCWEWLGRIDASEGYGRYGNGMAHRVVYELLVGPIPDGLVIDHLCRNRSCVNPDHLEPVTNRVNVLRGQAPSVQAWRENRCQKGHDFTPENTDHQRDGRRCKECRRERERKLRNAKRERDFAALQADPTSRPHGSYVTYNTYGCRCDECRHAWNARARMYKARRAS